MVGGDRVALTAWCAGARCGAY